MNALIHQQSKQLITSGHDIAHSAKRVQHDLLLLIEGTRQLNSVHIDIKETTDSILIELNQARGVLTEVIASANNIYHAGLDALKGGEL